MNILCKRFNELTSYELYEILQLRSEVFVVEQTCIYQDIDGKDTQPGVCHLLMQKEGKLIGYARLLPRGLSYQAPSIGRVIVAKQARGQHLGKKLIAHCLQHIEELWPNEAVSIGAQSHLAALYQSFGFQEVSQHYLEDGIKHVDMTATHFKYKELL